MNMNIDSREAEFATAVAATAFAIHKKQEREQDYNRNVRENSELSRPKARTRSEKLDSVRSLFMSGAGETSSRKPVENVMPKPGWLPSTRPPTRAGATETRPDSWETAQLRKIQKRFEKTKSDILEWENAKKMQAKLHMEKKKNELELRRTRNMQHYQKKISRTELVADGARVQLEEKRRNEESEVKEKAKYRRSKGHGPLKCCCCN